MNFGISRGLGKEDVLESVLMLKRLVNGLQDKVGLAIWHTRCAPMGRWADKIDPPQLSKIYLFKEPEVVPGRSISGDRSVTS